MMQQYDRLAGGFIWHFQDQGIRRILDPDFENPAPADQRAHEGRYSRDGTVWLDARTYLDSNGDSGTDGIVYADREPQPDYWEVRKVYSPVKIREDTVRTDPGQQKIELTLENRYDFTDLSETVIQWELIQDNESILGGNLEISLPPRQTGPGGIDLDIPTALNAHDYRLLFSFINRAGQSINEHVIHLLPRNGESNFSHRLTDLDPGSIQVTEQSDSTIIQTNVSEMKISRTTGMIKIYAEEEEIVSKAPVIRVGRKATMVDRRQYLEKMNWQYWEPYLLSPAALIEQNIEEYPESVIVRAVYQYLRPGDAEQQIVASVVYEIHNNGTMKMTYALQPENTRDFFLELGIGLLMPEKYGGFQWLGDGFHASYPGKSAHAIRGVYSAQAGELHTYGNRANLDLAAIIGSAGNGIGMLPGGADLSVEAAEEGICITNNLLVSGRGTKPTGMITEYLIPASEVGAVSGEFTILPLTAGNWPNLFQTFFSE
jgi:beta-galactosidase